MAAIKALCLLFVLASTSSAIILNCKFSNAQWLLIGSRYTCEATVNSQSQTGVEVVGNHLSGRNNANVEVLTVSNEKSLTTLPSGIQQAFPNLVGLQWVISSLRSISANDLKPFPKLQVLSVHYNSFTTLPGDLFVHTPKLQWISFASNSIQSVGANLLTNLSDLKNANFQSNRCIDLNVGNPQGIVELRARLANQCSSASVTVPSTTQRTASTNGASATQSTTRASGTTPGAATNTQPGSCSVRCSINEETDLLKSLVATLTVHIAELERLMNGASTAASTVTGTSTTNSQATTTVPSSTTTVSSGTTTVSSGTTTLPGGCSVRCSTNSETDMLGSEVLALFTRVDVLKKKL